MKNLTENNVVLEMKNISKQYKVKGKKLEILNNINISFKKGTFYAITGHSGSGKSTFINILGLMDEFNSGTLELNNKNIKGCTDKEISELRMKNIGFIFQNFQLDENLKAIENVILPMLINKNINKKERKQIALSLLKKVGLENRTEHFPRELSGGEQQRVAIARALSNNPNIILADEPTGNLDKNTEISILNLLKKLSDDGKCVIVVSHSDKIKEYADYVYIIDDGKIIGEKNEINWFY